MCSRKFSSPFKWISLVFIILILHRIFGTTPKNRRLHIAQEYYNEKWVKWKETHGKIYTRQDEQFRFEDWLQNFKEVLSHNRRYFAGNESYCKELTKFADYTPETNRRRMPEAPFPIFHKRPFQILVPQDIPVKVNWALQGWTSEAKNQKFYPNGWAFSATGAIHAQIFNLTGNHIVPSMRELVDCVQTPRGRPPISLDAFDYIQQNGVTLDSFYSMGSICKKMYCRRNKHHPKITLKDFHLLQPEDEENLKTAVALIGPISVSIRVTGNFFFYKSGVFYDPGCGQGFQPKANHAVLLVGYGTDRVAGDFWVIQNNWGSNWGENGFARMSRNVVINCGIASAAVYPVV